MQNIKTKVVKNIPGTFVRKSAYQRFWDELVTVPKDQYLEITADIRTQKLIAAFLYYKGVKAKKPVGVVLKKKKMYARFRA